LVPGTGCQRLVNLPVVTILFGHLSWEGCPKGDL
jgi:hypothetical protein